MEKKPIIIVAFFMVLCCGLPLLLVAGGLGAIGIFIQSNLFLIIAGTVLVVGIGYTIYRGHCKTSDKKLPHK